MLRLAVIDGNDLGWGVVALAIAIGLGVVYRQRRHRGWAGGSAIALILALFWLVGALTASQSIESVRILARYYSFGNCNNIQGDHAPPNGFVSCSVGRGGPVTVYNLKTSIGTFDNASLSVYKQVTVGVTYRCKVDHSGVQSQKLVSCSPR